MEKIKINYGSMKKLPRPEDQLICKHGLLFQEWLGTLKGMQASITVKQGSNPNFFNHQSLLYAIKGTIEQELERLERKDIIKPVKCSDWAVHWYQYQRLIT